MVEVKVTIHPSYDWAEDAKEYGVSHRELEILSLFIKGKENKEIAEILGIQYQSVKNHMYKLMKKLKVSNGGQAIVIAILKHMMTVEESAGPVKVEYNAQTLGSGFNEYIKEDKSFMGLKTRSFRKAMEKHNIDLDEFEDTKEEPRGKNTDDNT